MPGIPILDQVLPQQVFAFLLLFARVGAMLMSFPAIGEAFVSPRLRLGLALATSFVLMPVLSGQIPALPSDGGNLLILIGLELLIGLAIGTAARILFSALNIGGTVIAMQTGLAFATTIDPTQGGQSAIVTSFLSSLAIMMLFITGGHQLLFGAIVHSYDLFKVGAAPPLGDFVELVTRYTAASFTLGVELSVPFLVLSLVFYAGLGVVAKLMPQFQVFFISQPLSILAGFGLLMVLLGTIMSLFLDRFADNFGGLAR